MNACLALTSSDFLRTRTGYPMTKEPMPKESPFYLTETSSSNPKEEEGSCKVSGLMDLHSIKMLPLIQQNLYH